MTYRKKGIAVCRDEAISSTDEAQRATFYEAAAYRERKAAKLEKWFDEQGIAIGSLERTEAEANTERKAAAKTLRAIADEYEAKVRAIMARLHEEIMAGGGGGAEADSASD